MFRAVDPATGAHLYDRALDSAEEVQARLERAHRAWRDWAARAPEARAPLFLALADGLASARDRLAETITREMGKPIVQARAEIDKCAWLCRHVAEHGPADLEEPEVRLDGARARIRWAPQGLVLGIMPWNFPFWQVFRFAVPTLMAGNGVIIKHAPNVPGCAEAIAALFAEAGFDAFETIFVEPADCEAVIADERVRGVSLTGSRRAGREVAALAGRYLKKSVMELGGADPYIVLEDAELEQAVRTCVAGRLLNSGQTCIAAKRWIVVDAVYDAFRELAVEELGRAVLDSPMDEATTVGPIAREDLRARLDAQVRESEKRGARIVLGGRIPDGPGFFYPVTLLEDVVPGMPAFDEELFGPAAVLIRASDEDHAVRLANASRYGLGAGVFSRDVARAERLAERLDVGAVAVNDFVKSDPRLPFGGVKESGYGRELAAIGMREFVNIQTITVPEAA